MKDISSGERGSYPIELTRFQSATWFVAREPGTSERGLWRTDGTPAGTVRVLDGGEPRNLKAFGTANSERLMFQAGDGFGVELWLSDGTTAGTSRFADLFPGGGSSIPTLFTEHQGALYFFAFIGHSNQALWRTDGTTTGTQLVGDLGPGSSTPGAMVSTPGGLVFFDAATHWVSDGTSAGTLPIIQEGVLEIAAAGVGAYYMTVADHLKFIDGTTSGTLLVEDFNPGGFAVASDLTAFGARAIVRVSGQSSRGLGTWLSDGVPGTALQLHPSGSTRISRAVLGANLIFSAYGELWRSNGTIAGTALVRDIRPGCVSTGSQRLSGCELFLGTDLYTLSVTAIQNGLLSQSLPVPNDPNLAGLKLRVQAITLGSASLNDAATTQAMALTLGN